MKSKRAETYRLKRLATIETQIHESGYQLVAGVDEAGRGPLAGPLVAAACILPADFRLRQIDDSKKLDPDLRLSLYEELVLHPKVQWAVCSIEAVDIDRLNIHGATLAAMAGAIRRLPVVPDFLIVDGKHTPKMEIPAEAIVDGDRHAQCIAAASILAKVTRDQIMMGYEKLYPGYGFSSHKGYGTKQHLEALKTLGPSPIHRMSFKGI